MKHRCTKFENERCTRCRRSEVYHHLERIEQRLEKIECLALHAAPLALIIVVVVVLVFCLLRVSM